MLAPDTTRDDIRQEEEIAETIGEPNSADAPPVTQDARGDIPWPVIALDVEPNPPRAPSGTPLTAADAVQLAVDIVANARNADATAFRACCLRAFEGAAYVALGFGTWPAFVESLGLREASSTPAASLRAHPAAELFPLIDGAEFDALVEDIREHGQREPIVIMPDGSILDGRNRARACRQLGLEPVTRVYDGDDPIAFVVSLNLKRRHLTTSQRAMIAASLATLPRGTNQHASIEAPSQERAAKAFKVSRSVVQRAAKVRAEGSSELIAAAERGEVSVSAAAGQLRTPRPEKPVGVPEPKSARPTDRTPEAGSRISPLPSVTTTHAATEPQTLAEAVHRVAAAVRDGAHQTDIAEAVSVALGLHSDRDRLPGREALGELVGELLDVVCALVKGAA